MPASENQRTNQQEPTLANPSLPDHDRRRDEGMRAAIPEETMEQEDMLVDLDLADDSLEAPDQEFGQILESGTKSNGGRIPEDPNNWLTSDKDKLNNDMDPEDRGESLVDDLDGDKH